MNYLAQYFYFIASIVLTCYALVVSSSILNPLLAAFILALALQPLATRLEMIKIPRLLSAVICVIFFIWLILIILVFFSWQVQNMNFEMDSIKITFSGVSSKIQHVLKDNLNISLTEQAALLKEFYTSTLKNSASLFNNTFSYTTNFLSAFVLFALSLTFMLYYRGFLRAFLFEVIHSKYHPQLKKIVKNIQMVVSHYIFGLALIITTVAILNSMGLLLLGIQNAIVFGVMAAILTLIPYIGIMIGSLLPMLFAFFTKDSLWYPFGVLAIFMFVQFIEGNFLTPNIVGRQVSINPFAAILGLICGGMLLGVVGIIFALPLLAILKAICDEIPALKPIGYLVGNETQVDEEQVA